MTDDLSVTLNPFDDSESAHPATAHAEIGDMATELAALGLPVITLRPNTKEPTQRGWPNKGTTDASEARRLFPPATHNNVGFVAGKPLADGGFAVVIDIDTKKGKRGRESLAELEREFGNLPNTRRHGTAHKGWHLILRSKGPIRGRKGFRDGIDILGVGSFAVAPGSTLDGQRYSVENSAEIARLPDQWERQFGIAEERPQRVPSEAIVETEAAVRRATDYLQSDAPVAVEGQNGDDTTYRVACRVKDLGCSAGTAFDLMAEHWNGRCSPPWPNDELQKKIRNAYAYGNDPPGVASPERDFPALSASKPASAIMFKTVGQANASALANIKRPRLVKDMFDHRALVELYGPTNVGKTFVALHIAWCITRGLKVFGRKSQRGAVLYIAAEAGADAENRIAALVKRNGHSDAAAPLYLYTDDANLKDTAWLGAIIAAVRDAEKSAGEKVVLIVVDTLSASMRGDENSTADMAEAVRGLKKLRDECSATVMVVHHAGKNLKQGSRGSSDLPGKVDTVFEIKDGAIKAEKQRGMAKLHQPIGFRRAPVIIGQDADGDFIESCVIEEIEARRPALKPTTIPGKMVRVWQDLAINGHEPSVDEWRAGFIGQNYAGNHDLGRTNFNRALPEATRYVEASRSASVF